MSVSARKGSPELLYLPDVAVTRFYVGALAKLSVLQYFVAEAAVIGSWAGRAPYSRRTGYISDLGALGCSGFAGRDVCSPAHLLMNASFVVQGIGMMVGALLLSSAVIGSAAVLRGVARGQGRTAVAGGRTAAAGRPASFAALTARALSLTAGAGTVIVGLVPEDAGSGWHLVGALMYFAAGGLALLLVGWMWRRQTPLGWFILACGAVSLAALVAGGVTDMHVPEPGTLERLMGYPITIGMAALGLVVAQRVRQDVVTRRRQRAQGRAPHTADPAPPVG